MGCKDCKCIGSCNDNTCDITDEQVELSLGTGKFTRSVQEIETYLDGTWDSGGPRFKPLPQGYLFKDCECNPHASRKYLRLQCPTCLSAYVDITGPYAALEQVERLREAHYEIAAMRLEYRAQALLHNLRLNERE